MNGCECRDKAASLKDGSANGKSSERRKKLDNAVRVVQDASKPGFHGKVIVTVRDGIPQLVEVAETHKL